MGAKIGGSGWEKGGEGPKLGATGDSISTIIIGSFGLQLLGNATFFFWCNLLEFISFGASCWCERLFSVKLERSGVCILLRPTDSLLN